MHVCLLLLLPIFLFCDSHLSCFQRNGLEFDRYFRGVPLGLVRLATNILIIGVVWLRNILIVLQSVSSLSRFVLSLKTMAGEEGFYEVAVEPLRQFAKDSMHLVKKCTKPDRKEFTAIAKATGVGFAIMGFIGFFVKLIHIPINNILVGN